MNDLFQPRTGDHEADEVLYEICQRNAKRQDTGNGCGEERAGVRLQEHKEQDSCKGGEDIRFDHA